MDTFVSTIKGILFNTATAIIVIILAAAYILWLMLVPARWISTKVEPEVRTIGSIRLKTGPVIDIIYMQHGSTRCYVLAGSGMQTSQYFLSQIECVR